MASPKNYSPHERDLLFFGTSQSAVAPGIKTEDLEAEFDIFDIVGDKILEAVGILTY